MLCVIQSEVQSHLINIQSEFKGTLLENVEVFKQDVDMFSGDYSTVSNYSILGHMGYSFS